MNRAITFPIAVVLYGASVAGWAMVLPVALGVRGLVEVFRP